MGDSQPEQTQIFCVETEIHRLLTLKHSLSTEHDLLVFQHAQAQVHSEMASEAKTRLLLENQLLVDQIRECQSNVHQSSRELGKLQSKCKQLSTQRESAKQRLQSLEEQVRLYLVKKGRAKELISQQTKKRVVMSVQCSQMLESMSDIHTRIQQARKQRKLLTDAEKKLQEQNSQMEKVLSELKGIYHREGGGV